MSSHSNAPTDSTPRSRLLHRRRFLSTTVAGSLAVLAGCTGDSPNTQATTSGGATPNTAERGERDTTTTDTQTEADETTPASTESGSDGAATTQYEPREGCTVTTSTEMRVDETVTVHPINGVPETEWVRFTYQGIDAEKEGEIRVEYPDGFTLDRYIKEGQRTNIDAVTGIELTALGEAQIQVQFLKISAESDPQSEWAPVEVERC